MSRHVAPVLLSHDVLSQKVLFSMLSILSGSSSANMETTCVSCFGQSDQNYLPSLDTLLDRYASHIHIIHPTRCL